MESVRVILFLVVAVGTATCQVPFLGRCPNPSVVTDFDASRYIGTWYENRKYFAIFQAFGRCVSAEYTDDGDGLIGVTNRQISLFGNEKTVTGQAKLADPSGTVAKLEVKFFSSNPFPDPTAVSTRSNYWVLDTDYDTYAVVWSCSDKFFYNAQFLWILTRDRSPDQSVIDSALSVVTDRGLSTSKLSETNQSNC